MKKTFVLLLFLNTTKSFQFHKNHKTSLLPKNVQTTIESPNFNFRKITNTKLKLQELDFEEEIQPQVYGQRWVQLGYLSMLALLSDWICFGTAATPSVFADVYPGHTSANLIDIFLFTNVISCFVVTDIVANLGLGRAIKGAAVLMTAGCFLRSGFDLNNFLHLFDGSSVAAASNVSYPLIVAGTVLVGAAQPFFQCTPPMLSATWFPSNERATSTAVAINFNQIGIATAFLVGGTMATSGEGLAQYFTLISLASVVIAIGTLIQFQDKPETPPSTSEIAKMMSGEEEPPFFESVKLFFKTPGFTKPLAAFVCSISITNIVGAFIDEVLERGGITDQTQIDLAGAGFELAILVGGIVIGGYVDKTKQYKNVTLLCLLSTMLLVFPLGLTDHAMGNEPLLLLAALWGLGMAAGPVQPINAELAVDVTYPSDETAVESVQQIFGNLFSALIIPLAELSATKDFEFFKSSRLLDSDIRGDVILLFAIASATMVYYTGFDSPLRRTIADCGDDGVCEKPELNMKNLKESNTDSFFKDRELLEKLDAITQEVED